MTQTPAQGGWLPLAATLAIQSMVAMALITLPVMAPQVAAALSVSPALLGVYVSATYVGATVASLMGGVAVTRCALIGDANSDLRMAVAAGIPHQRSLGYTAAWSTTPALAEPHPRIHHWSELSIGE